MARGSFLALTAAACLSLSACGQQGTGNETGTSNASGASSDKGDAAPGKSSILDTLTGSADHSTLANAVKAAGLTETLSGAQPYTLFAPSDAAFQRLPAGAANGLLEPQAKGQLVALLTGHIVQGVVTSQDLASALERGKGKAQLATVGGSTLTIARGGDAIVVTDSKGGQARVTQPDMMQSNGVVHSVDAVLMGR
jgi:uncharacterized surface protein with fasciclin (FAS1) repeats